ncbi:carbohydrate ABC transporter permease [Paenibacillus sp. NFR01]|uniref:carbohydrate ABC transporter permease n=1 Tax=Paenibacillus sp. NFR01 TaxID=1566279 RepID=UPI0008AE09AD|nr:carbohydrate ABC transporter permease [Paenibacillus sp. NFR01]SET09615.1 putative aldouronate transport system permease protein [Paenibacillus sp. NFR01]
MKTSNGVIAMRSKKRFDIWDVLIRLALIIVSLACLLPFVHVVSKSFSEDAYVIANKVILWPEGFTIEAYKKIFADDSILRSFGVSVLVTVLFTILGMVITIFAAYPLSRKQLKGRTVLTLIFTIPLFFSGGIIPEFMNISNLGLLDTLWSLILPLAFSAFNLLIMKSSLTSSIPVSLEESAWIDGASHFRILWSIVLPLSKPILATLSLFYAVGRWNAYQDALFYIKQNTDLRPLQLKLYYLIIQASESFQLEATSVKLSNPEVLKASCVVFATVPILCIYPFIQKYFVQGVMLGAIKE